MRKSFFPVAAILLLSVTALPPRAHAVAKEIIELQTQVSQLQDMISQMKQSNDERMGVLLHMVQQNADSITRMTTQVGAMQQALSSQNENQQLSGQMQSLNDSVDELRRASASWMRRCNPCRPSYRMCKTRPPPARRNRQVRAQRSWRNDQ